MAGLSLISCLSIFVARGSHLRRKQFWILEGKFGARIMLQKFREESVRN